MKTTQMTPQERRERKLFAELQNKFGYRLLEAGRGMEKTKISFDPKTRKLEACINVQLCVPSSSLLGKLFSERRAKEGIKARTPQKPDRREGDRRASKRRLDDKRKAALKPRRDR